MVAANENVNIWILWSLSLSLWKFLTLSFSDALFYCTVITRQTTTINPFYTNLKKKSIKLVAKAKTRIINCIIFSKNSNFLPWVILCKSTIHKHELSRANWVSLGMRALFSSEILACVKGCKGGKLLILSKECQTDNLRALFQKGSDSWFQSRERTFVCSFFRWYYTFDSWKWVLVDPKDCLGLIPV